MDEKYNRFCDLLSDMIKNAKMTHTDFYTQLGIKKPYFYDILRGKTNPPPPQKQFKIIEILDIKDADKKSLFFELAAKERKEVPADIAMYLENTDVRSAIRNKREYKKMFNSTLSNKAAGKAI